MARGDAPEGKWWRNWRMEWVASNFTLPRNMVYPALLPLMRTLRLPVVDWTDASAELNGLVRFAERRNVVSALVSSHFKWPLPRNFPGSKVRPALTADSSAVLVVPNFKVREEARHSISLWIFITSSGEIFNFYGCLLTNTSFTQTFDIVQLACRGSRNDDDDDDYDIILSLNLGIITFRLIISSWE